MTDTRPEPISNKRRAYLDYLKGLSEQLSRAAWELATYYSHNVPPANGDDAILLQRIGNVSMQIAQGQGHLRKLIDEERGKEFGYDGEEIPF